MKDVLLYMHGGSGNKGCEAIVRSTVNILNKKEKNKFTLASWNVDEDKKAGIDSICKIKNVSRKYSKKNIFYLFAAAWYRITKNVYPMYLFRYNRFQKRNYSNMLAFSIGGDNYCYEGSPEIIKLHHDKVKKEAEKSYLWGCSIEESMLNNKVIEDLKRYDVIFARESITYESLKNAGLTNVKLYPDPAFTLPVEECRLPGGFEEGNTIGFNLSPYAFSGNAELAAQNYENLIQWILDNTDMKIALIPHVNKPGNSDDASLKIIKNRFSDEERVVVVHDRENCMQTKYIISKCRFFVGARTHSTIAAYSTKVPTLVLGYSVKSRGIAKDIFGDDENYVISVKDFKTEKDVLESFKSLYENEIEIREHYDDCMDEYIDKAYSAADEVF